MRDTSDGYNDYLIILQIKFRPFQLTLNQFLSFYIAENYGCFVFVYWLIVWIIKIGITWLYPEGYYLLWMKGLLILPHNAHAS